MKAILGICAALGVLAYLLTLGVGCAHGPNPCIGSAADREMMPCTCPATTNPGCQPWILDAKNHPDAGASR